MSFEHSRGPNHDGAILKSDDENLCVVSVCDVVQSISISSLMYNNLLCHEQREVTRVRMAQTLRGDLTSQQEADLVDLLAERVSLDLSD